MYDAEQMARLVRSLLARGRTHQTTCGHRLMVEVAGPDQEDSGEMLLYLGSGSPSTAGDTFEIQLWVDIGGHWAPYDTLHLSGGQHIVAKLDLVEGRLMLSEPMGEQAEELPGNSPPWPEPTVAEPDLETLEEWLWEDGGCEATDSCWVCADSVCPHRHPAWLLKLGLI